MGAYPAPLSLPIAALLGCRKVAYLSEESANATMARIHAQTTAATTKVPVKAYQCRMCLRWHLTSQS